MKGKTYTELIYGEILNYWWKDKIIVHDSKIYKLNDIIDRTEIFNLLTKYFPNSRIDSIYTSHNFMYYFDHKIADYFSSFPSVYQLGIIISDIELNIDERIPESIDTYDNTKKPSKICHIYHLFKIA